jgi:hypothetical protein
MKDKIYTNARPVKIRDAILGTQGHLECGCIIECTSLTFWTWHCREWCGSKRPKCIGIQNIGPFVGWETDGGLSMILIQTKTPEEVIAQNNKNDLIKLCNELKISIHEAINLLSNP